MKFQLLTLLILFQITHVLLASRISGTARTLLSMKGGNNQNKTSRKTNKKLTWSKMIKSFWLTLIDPSNEEYLLAEQKPQNKNNNKKESSSTVSNLKNLFTKGKKSSKSVGKSLK